MRPYESPEDGDLIARAKEGNMEAFESLIRKYQRNIYLLCHRVTGAHQAADDLAQETFIKAYFALAHFINGMDFYSWIRRIAMNNCLNHLKKGRRERPLDEGAKFANENVSSSPQESPQEEVERNEIQEKFKKAFSALPPDQRAIFILRVHENQSYKEIAQSLDIPEGTVMSRLARARKKLKDMMADFLRRNR